MDYVVYQIAKLEHEHRVKSLPAEPEYNVLVDANRPGWISEHAGHLLYALGDGLVALGERLKQGQGQPMNAPCVEQS
jgi:hypothetical protein